MSATPIILSGTTDKNNVIDVDVEPVVEKEIDITTALAAARPFTGLSGAILDVIAEGAIIRKYAAGQTVYSMGQYDGGEVFVVAKGQMRVSLTDAETGAMMIDDIGAGAAFAIDLTFASEDSALFQRFSVTAESDLTLVLVDVEVMRAAAGQRPSFMRNLARYFAEELQARRFNAAPGDVAPEQRVFAELMKFVERDNVMGAWRVSKMPKHRELADLANVEEGVAAGAVAILIQEGVAQRDYPGLIITDMSRLNQLAG